MRAGRLRHAVTIQTQATTINAYGENEGGWTDLETVHAAIEPISGKELIASGQNLATSAVKILIRYCQHVVPQMRLIHGSIIYNIEAVLNRDERNREMELICMRGGHHAESYSAPYFDPIAREIWDNLTAAYDFEGGSLNDVKGTNHLTAVGALSTITGKNGDAIEMGTVEGAERSGTDSGPMVWDFTSSFMIVGWAQYSAGAAGYGAPQMLARANGSTRNEYVLVLDAGAGTVQMRLFNGSTLTETTATESGLTHSTWYWIVGYYDAATNRAHVRVNNGTIQQSAGTFGGEVPTSSAVDALTRVISNNDHSRSDGHGLFMGWLPSQAHQEFMYNSGVGRTWAEIKAMAGY